MSKQINFLGKNARPFNSWLKKFATVDTALLLEIDEINGMFLAKVYNEEHSVVKFSSIRFDEAGFTVVPSKDPKRIKVGIYNIARLMKIIDQFATNEFDFIVNYDEIQGNVVEFAGVSLLLRNKNLKMTVECTSLNIFKYITDELFKTRISALDNVVASFKLSKDNIEKTNSLCSLDNEYKFMEFKRSSNVFIAGKTFDLLIQKIENEWDGSENSLNIFKEQFASVDIDNYNVDMGDDRLVFTSDDLNTIITISMVEKDTN